MKNVMNAICSKGLPQRDIKNANRVNLFALLWAGTLLLASLADKYLTDLSALASATIFIIHLGISAALFYAFRHFLIQLDELQKKIQLDALAISVGMTILAFSSYSILERQQWLPELEANYLIVIMALSYMCAILIGRLRYR